MVIYIDANIEVACLHMVGNKIADDGIKLSKSQLKLSPELKEILLKYFVNPFKTDEFYKCYHDNDINLNEVYHYCSRIFDNPEVIYDESINLAKHLYNVSVHPKIKNGELYVAYLKDCIVDGNTTDAIGIFKSENKDTFLKVLQTDNGFDIESENGININKLDKGCLIFNVDKEDGYLVAVVDNTNKGADAKYWTDDFLHVRQRKDEYANTQNVMAMAKNFVTQELPKEFEVTKADQIDLLNKSLQFFKDKDTFDIEEFANEVMEQPAVIESFHNFKKNYEEDNAISIDDNFAISNNAFKKQQRSYKRVIRLDNKIQIIIDGNRDHIEQGEDSKGKYYKVYYSEEE